MICSFWTKNSMSSFKGTSEDLVVWLLVIHFDVLGSIPRSIHFSNFWFFQQKTKVKAVETLGSSTLIVLNWALISINACLMTNYDIKLKKNYKPGLTRKTGWVTGFHRFFPSYTGFHWFNCTADLIISLNRLHHRFTVQPVEPADLSRVLKLWFQLLLI